MSIIPTSLVGAFMFLTIFVYLSPGFAVAKHGGTSITRHYKFDVCYFTTYDYIFHLLYVCRPNVTFDFRYGCKM